MEQNHQVTKCRNFLKNHDVGVLATSSLDAIPHASAVNYFMDHGVEMFFLAREDSHKFKNLAINETAVLVVASEGFASTVEVKGTAERLEDSPEVNNMLRKFSESIRRKNPGPLPLLEYPGSELHLFRLTPYLFRYADFRPTHTSSGEYFEIHL